MQNKNRSDKNVFAHINKWAERTVNAVKYFEVISSKKVLSEITFEIVGMMKSDINYDDEEKEFMNTLSEVLEIPKSKISKMFELVNRYTELFKEIDYLMLEK